MNDARLPNLLLIGVPKAATTSLADALSSSPDVVLGATKEPGILGNLDYGPAEVRRLFDSHYPAGAGLSKYRLDATPWTFYERTAPTRLGAIADSSDQPLRVLLSLREPISRIRSMYMDQFVRGRERRSLDEALVEGIRMRTPSQLSTSYVSTSLYGRHLQEWLEIGFRSIDVRVAFFDDIVNLERSAELITALGTWLGLSLSAVRPANVRTDSRRRLARPIDAAVRAGSHLPAGPRAFVRPATASLARLLLRRSPLRRVPLPDVEIKDEALQRELGGLLAADLKQLRNQLTTDRLLLPGRPGWVDP